MVLSCLKVTVIFWASTVVWTLGSRHSIRAAAIPTDRRAAVIPDLPSQQARDTGFRNPPGKAPGKCLPAQACLLQLPVLVAGAGRAACPQRAGRRGAPIGAAAVRALAAALGASPCRGLLREAEPMGTCRAGLRLPADRKQVHAVVFGGWSVLIP